VWKSSKNGGLRKMRVKWKRPWSKYETINEIGWIIIRKKNGKYYLYLFGIDGEYNIPRKQTMHLTGFLCFVLT
jgi:hypothetical protein